MDKYYSKKKFGQHFLKDEKILKKISETINIEDKQVIEIGPGKGALTKFLVEKAKKVIAFEIDKNLSLFLKETFKNAKNLELINNDFLKEDLSSYKDFLIVANIPYNISTDIIFKILENYSNFEHVVLLVQKEFGKRLCATKNTKDYSKLSPSIALFYEAKYCFEVQPTSFFPKPKVISALVYLKKKNITYNVDYFLFLDFIKMCFSMKRKTLWNNIKHFQKIDHETFLKICSKLNIDTLSRPENLDLDQFINLYNEIMSINI